MQTVATAPRTHWREAIKATDPREAKEPPPVLN
jgi:hypothetical protein